MLTGIRDLDYKILNELEDRDLVSICLSNKEASKLCNDQTFWLNRILTKFPNVPSEVFLKNKKGRWSDYYIKDLRELNTLKLEPTYILNIGADNGRDDWLIIGLNRGADIHEDNDYALRSASEKGYSDVVRLLLQAGADVHAPDYGGPDASLRLTSSHGHPAVVKILLEAGADVHAVDDFALRLASRYGYLETVKMLLEAGADVHADDDYALEMASVNGYSEIIKILLEAGASNDFK